jgi:multidrug efflux pump subunit AcrA (membrane-fusion protein)
MVLRPMGSNGQCVVKDPRAGKFFNLGAEESFLFQRLDGRQTVESLCAAFEDEFGELLSPEDLDDFLTLAREQGFLRSDKRRKTAAGSDVTRDPDETLWALRNWPLPDWAAPAAGDADVPAAGRSRPRRASPIYSFRIPFFDPDALLSRLEPRLRFFWTRGFMIVSLLGIAAAAMLMWVDRLEMIARFPTEIRWQMVGLAWLTLALVTTCHELAHGLTCKHYGGEVHEVGFLLLYFMPCFYCNVSDTWLFPEKSKRLWVMLAGSYIDLVLWALGVFTWRATLEETLLNQFAWTVVSICGFRLFLNFNPLMKLDGYYIVSDLLEMPNLRRRAREALMGRIRHWLWGAPRPEPEPRGRFLFSFGLLSWAFSLVFFTMMVTGMARYLNPRGGLAGLSWAVFLGLVSTRRLFRGFTAGEFTTMILTRHRRLAMWGLILSTLILVLSAVSIEDRVSGTFQFRPASRAELRAPIAGFLQSVAFDEGSRVSPGEVIARLEVPDLATRIAQKKAEARESRARLRMLEVGPRPEEVVEQRQRVERAIVWRDLARHELDRGRQTFQEELTQMTEQIRSARAQSERASDALVRARRLMERQALQVDELRETEKTVRVTQAQLAEAEARHRARLIEATLKQESELAKREHELADAQATLRLMEAGTRPEEIEAESAHLARLVEEERYLDGLQSRLLIQSPVSGVITTPRLKERVGQHLQEGELIGEVEALSVVEAEIALAEHDIARVRPGQRIHLKARSHAFETFATQVDRIGQSTLRSGRHGAPGAPAGAEQLTAPPPGPESAATVVVYCHLAGGSFDLRTGMTGYARVFLGRRPIGEILAHRVLRLLRTELWW